MINSILVFKIDVGQMPPFNAEAFIARIKDGMKELVEELHEQGTRCVFMPVRPNSETSVELMTLPQQEVPFEVKMSQEKIRKLEDLKLQVMAQNPHILGVPAGEIKKFKGTFQEASK